MPYCQQKAGIVGRKTIDFVSNLDDFIEMAVEQRGYKTETEYLSYLVCKDQEKK